MKSEKVLREGLHENDLDILIRHKYQKPHEYKNNQIGLSGYRVSFGKTWGAVSSFAVLSQLAHEFSAQFRQYHSRTKRIVFSTHGLKDILKYFHFFNATRRRTTAYRWAHFKWVQFFSVEASLGLKNSSREQKSILAVVASRANVH